MVLKKKARRGSFGAGPSQWTKQSPISSGIFYNLTRNSILIKFFTYNIAAMVIIVVIILIFLLLLIDDVSISGGSSPGLVEYLSGLHVIGDCSTFTGGALGGAKSKGLFSKSLNGLSKTMEGSLVGDSEILMNSKTEDTNIELFVNLYANSVNEKLWN